MIRQRKFHLIILFLSFLLLFQAASAQGSKRANVWYFGFGAGIDFNSGVPTPISGSNMKQWEGTASICDGNGNLLLYTNGIEIWNNKHQVIKGATDLGGNDSATQSAIIIPKPDNPDIFYVFTTFTYLTCIVVDLSLNQGEGGIVSKDILMEHSTEKLTAVQHCNGSDFWILAHESGNNVFRSYLVTKNGLETSYVENKVGNKKSAQLGYLKFSPSGTRLAAALFGKSTFELYDFNNSFGIISNPVSVSDPDLLLAYGLEFSPDENFLYVTETLATATSIFQFDISVNNPGDILKSKVTIGRTTESYFGALKLGPDKKIYVAKNGLKSLGVINNPNAKGLGSNYVSKGFDLGKAASGIGLPNFVSSFDLANPSLTVMEDKNCNEITLTAHNYPVSANDVYQWYDSGFPIENPKEIAYKPSRSGNYSVMVTNSCTGEKRTSEIKKIEILKAEPIAVKVNCGFYKLITNANSDFEWTGEGIKETDQGADSIIVSASGIKTFNLKVFNKEDPSCFIEKQLEVDFGTCDARIFIPDIFTPNQDGVNDIFKVVIIGGNAVRLDVYNRWGSLIYTDVNGEWDGKVNSSLCADGDYIYVFKYRTGAGDEFVRRGAILLHQ